MCKIIDKTDKTFWNKELDVVLLEEDFPRIEQGFEYSFGENLDKIILELEGLLSSDIKEDDLDIIQDYMQLAFLSGHEEGMKDFLEGAELFPKTPDYDDKEDLDYKCTYDKNGNVTSITYYDSEGNVDYSSKYTYDYKGNMTSQTWYDSVGNAEESWKYAYDDKGNMTSELLYASEGTQSSKVRAVYWNLIITTLMMIAVTSMISQLK